MADSAVTPIPTFNNIDKHSIKQWAVKERFGYGSRNINLNISTKQALELCGNLDQDLIFQPFISGKEFTAETWISQSGKCHSPLLRWRTRSSMGSHIKQAFFIIQNGNDYFARFFAFTRSKRTLPCTGYSG